MRLPKIERIAPVEWLIVAVIGAIIGGATWASLVETRRCHALYAQASTARDTILIATSRMCSRALPERAP